MNIQEIGEAAKASVAPTEPEGIIDATLNDDELLKSTTVPMEPIGGEVQSSEELTSVPSDMLDEMQKATTVPMTPLDEQTPPEAETAPPAPQRRPTGKVIRSDR